MFALESLSIEVITKPSCKEDSGSAAKPASKIASIEIGLRCRNTKFRPLLEVLSIAANIYLRRPKSLLPGLVI